MDISSEMNCSFRIVIFGMSFEMDILFGIDISVGMNMFFRNGYIIWNGCRLNGYMVWNRYIGWDEYVL